MRTIHKYPFEVADTVTVQMPAGATILRAVEPDHATVGPGHLLVWAHVDTDQPMQDVTLAVVGTGHPTDRLHGARIAHIGTVVDGPFVWHVFGPRDAVAL